MLGRKKVRGRFEGTLILRCLFFLFIGVCLIILSTPFSRADDSPELRFWPRRDHLILPTHSRGIIYPWLPELTGVEGEVELFLAFPPGMSLVTVIEGADPHMLPDVGRVTFTAIEVGEETVKLRFPAEGLGRRISLLVEVETPPGKHTLSAILRLPEGGEILTQRDFEVHILEELPGISPRRLMVGVYTYVDFDQPVVRQAVADRLADAGVNTLIEMRFPGYCPRKQYPFIGMPFPPEGVGVESLIERMLSPITREEWDLTLSGKAYQRGVTVGYTWWWHQCKFAPIFLERHPESQAVIPEPWDPERLLAHLALHAKSRSPISPTYLLAHRQQTIKEIQNFIYHSLTELPYRHIMIDAEEPAYHPSERGIFGCFSEASLAVFRQRYNIPAEVELNPDIIARKYLEEWVDFRCWQTAEMARLFTEAVEGIDPAVSVSLYSGYQFAPGPLEDFTRRRWSVDWELLTDVGLDYGMTGYFGTPADIRNTARVLEGHMLYVPAEMFLENHYDFRRTVPSVESFELTLLRAVLNSERARGGIIVWYQAVLDGGGWASLGRVSAFLAQVENLLLEGERYDVVVAPAALRHHVWGYKLRGQRLVIAINPTARPLDFTIYHRNIPPRSIARDITLDKHVPRPEKISFTLTPDTYRAFIILNEGN